MGLRAKSNDLMRCPLCKKLPKLNEYTVEKDSGGHMYEFDRMFYECEIQKCAFRPKRLIAAVDEEYARLQWNECVTDALSGYPELFAGGGI
ncbi:hypothetical protein LCGC14_2140860 [marine sediment metagenome]|uniref:Uncharacterized protein n=1 Tax=marine sediment metagenome TaxID=412755 RepID=A0A0F9GUR8_9ZZZZ